MPLICLCLGFGAVNLIPTSPFVLATEQPPQVKVTGTFENDEYSSPDGNFTCKFRTMVAGDELSDESYKDGGGHVKYSSYFITDAVEYIPVPFPSSGLQSADQQFKELDALFQTMALPGLQSTFSDVHIARSEHLAQPQTALFTVAEYNVKSDSPHSAFRAELLFFQGSYLYSLDRTAPSYTPGYKDFTGEALFDRLKMETLDFWSNCHFN